MNHVDVYCEHSIQHNISPKNVRNEFRYKRRDGQIQQP